LSAEERAVVDEIVDENAFSKEEELETKCAEHSSLVRDVLKFHYIKREGIPPADESAKIIKIEEFEKSCPQTISAECARLLGKL
jgi:hypothetical protein